jgi:hypothetical protein
MIEAITNLIGTVLVFSALTVGGLVMLALYFLPSIIVLLRRNASMTAAVIVLNVVVGWTFLGWLIALVLSLLTFSSSHQHYYYAYPQPSPDQLVPATGGYQPVEASSNGATPAVPARALDASEDS